jgi:threonine synthase
VFVNAPLKLPLGEPRAVFICLPLAKPRVFCIIPTIASGKIPRDDSTVLCVTGNGLKTLDAVNGHVGKPREIKPSLREFEALLAHEEKVNA